MKTKIQNRLNWPGGAINATVALFLATILNSRAQYSNFVYTTFTVSGEESTVAYGVSGSNIVGTYYNGTNYQGFIYNAGNYVTLAVPGAAYTKAYGISGTNVVGSFNVYNGNTYSWYGFLYNGSTYTTLSVPQSIATYAAGISGTNIVGYYQSSISGNIDGFLYNGNTYTTFSVPGSPGTYAVGISGTNIVGYYQGATQVIYGFLFNGITYTTLSAPGAELTWAYGISGTNILGYYWTGNDMYGFLYNGNGYMTLSVPGAYDTYAYGISDNEIVGSYDSLNNGGGGFEAVPLGPTPTNSGCVGPPPGIVAWWPGNDNVDDIVGGNNGTLEGGVNYAPGEVGEAFDLNGVNGYVFVPASPNLNVGLSTGLTIELWMNPSNVNGANPLVEWNNGGTYGVHLWNYSSLGQLYANVVDTGGAAHELSSATGVLASNVWEHVALTYDKSSGLGCLYCNGNLVAQETLGSFTPQTTYNLYLGFRPPPTQTASAYAGLLNAVSIYNRALSQGEIQAIYNAGSAGKCESVPPQITTLSVANMNVVVTFLTGSNHVYGVQTETDLLSGNWSTIVSNIPSVMGPTNYTNIGGAMTPQMFYRTVQY